MKNLNNIEDWIKYSKKEQIIQKNILKKLGLDNLSVDKLKEIAGKIVESH
jgi:hypothetical protein